MQQTFLRPLASRLKTLVIDGVYFFDEEHWPVCEGRAGMNEYESTLVEMTHVGQLEYRNDFQVQYFGNAAMEYNPVPIVMAFQSDPQEGPTHVKIYQFGTDPNDVGTYRTYDSYHDDS